MHAAFRVEHRDTESTPQLYPSFYGNRARSSSTRLQEHRQGNYWVNRIVNNIENRFREMNVDESCLLAL